MARDGVFPERYARFNVGRGTVPAPTIVQIVLACVFVLVGTFNDILGYFVPCAVFFLGLAAAALLILPRPEARADMFRTPLHPLPIALFLVMVATVLGAFILGQPRQTLLGALVVALGIPVSWLVVSRR